MYFYGLFPLKLSNTASPDNEFRLISVLLDLSYKHCIVVMGGINFLTWNLFVTSDKNLLNISSLRVCSSVSVIQIN